MSEQTPEFDKLRETSESWIEHGGEQKSMTGSAHSIGLEPSDSFIAPTMALDSVEPEPNN